MKNLNDAKVFGIIPDNAQCEGNCGCEEQEIPKYLKDGRRKLNPEWVKREFAKENYTLLEEFTKATSLVAFRCPVGHEHAISYDAFNRGNRCLYCSSNAPLAIEDIRENFEKEGYTIIGKYRKSKIPIEVVCPKGHISKMVYNNFRNGARCSYCSGNNKESSKSKCEELFEAEGYAMLSTYINSEKHIKLICPVGHTCYITPNNFVNHGRRCGECSHNKKYTLVEVETIFKNVGYELLDKHYSGVRKPLKFRCNIGHEHQMSLSHLLRGQRCGKCTDRYNHTQESVGNFFESKGYKLLDIFTNTLNQIKVECPKKHLVYIKPSQFFRGARCGICFQEKLNGCTSLTAQKIYCRLKRKSNLPKEKLVHIANSLLTEELQRFYNKTPPECVVDHVIPVTWLSADNPEQIKLCWSLDNLQYLTFSENCRKSNNLTLQNLQALTPAQINILKSATKIPARHQKMVKDFLNSLEDELWFWSYEDTLAAT